jgi:hypothetical protein
MWEKRLSLTPNNNVRDPLMAPYRHGRSHVIFDPPDCFIGLVALAPKLKVDLARFNGVSFPDS